MADTGDAEPQARPVPPTTGAPAPVTLTAYLSEGSAPMTSGIVWRIFHGHPAKDGSYKLLQTLQDREPTVELNPGEYLINIAYGRAYLTKKIGVWPQNPVKEDFVVNAGGLRINATLAGAHLGRAPAQIRDLLRYAGSVRQPAEAARRHAPRRGDPAELRHLPCRQHLWRRELRGFDRCGGRAGQDPEAGIDHDAGKITLKLVQRTGGEAAADTHWIVYNAVGEVIKESAGAFPTHIGGGDYRVAAQHGDQQYAGAFTVAAGDAKLVEVLMQ